MNTICSLPFSSLLHLQTVKRRLKPEAIRSNLIIITLLSLIAVQQHAFGNNLFIDPLRGDDNNRGTLNEPLATLAQAVRVANSFTGEGPITVKLAPGVYELTDKVSVERTKSVPNASWFTIEALVMPDDNDWTPEKMPVILSVSANNSTNQFPHAVGVLVNANNVTVRGLKFLGNPNPTVKYYYPITKENEALGGMQISQCYFISEKHSTPIQGGVWAHGPNTDINHCVFYNCRNAILLFKSVEGFSITHTVMYGANESAVWMGPIDSGFVFKNNVIAKCHCFWVRPQNTTPAYEFSDCLITDTEIYMGYYTQKGVVAMPSETNTHIKEANLAHMGTVKLIEKNGDVLPAEYLNPAVESAGSNLGAGIFRRKPAN